jgi:hypothetical protein
MNTKNYLIVDLMTGALDGFYLSQKMAEDAYKRHKKRYKNQMWILVEILDMPQNAQIFDHMFHTEKLGKDKELQKAA